MNIREIIAGLDPETCQELLERAQGLEFLLKYSNAVENKIGLSILVDDVIRTLSPRFPEVFFNPFTEFFVARNWQAEFGRIANQMEEILNPPKWELIKNV